LKVRAEICLAIILGTGIFMVFGTFLEIQLGRFSARIQSVNPVEASRNVEQIVNNVFLVSYQPPYRLLPDLLDSGFVVVDETRYDNSVFLTVREKKASFVVQPREGGVFLFDEMGDPFWKVREPVPSKYQELPRLFGGSMEETREVLQQMTVWPLPWRNYISAVDVANHQFFLRGGNLLIVDSWQHLSKMNVKNFIQNLGIKQTYELYSSGQVLPVNRKR